MKKAAWFFLISFLLLHLSISEGHAKDIKYSVTSTGNGGYSLDIAVSKTIFFSADGLFQNVRNHYSIDLIGKGKDWSYKNQKGFYYSLNDIESTQAYWDIGYAWVDIDRKYIYLNFYWVSSPDNLIPSDVNGRYRIEEKK